MRVNVEYPVRDGQRRNLLFRLKELCGGGGRKHRGKCAERRGESSNTEGGFQGSSEVDPPWLNRDGRGVGGRVAALLVHPREHI